MFQCRIRRRWVLSRLTAHSCSRSDQSRQFDEIVGGHRPDELEVELLDAAQHGAGQAADGLAPAELFLDPLAFLLAGLVAGMAGGAAIDGGAAAGLFWATCGVTFDARMSATKSAVSKGLVGAHGDPPRA
jgi:hypothetical protein